jgi:hypothetical protein
MPLVKVATVTLCETGPAGSRSPLLTVALLCLVVASRQHVIVRCRHTAASGSGRATCFGWLLEHARMWRLKWGVDGVSSLQTLMAGVEGSAIDMQQWTFPGALTLPWWLGALRWVGLVCSSACDRSSGARIVAMHAEVTVDEVKCSSAGRGKVLGGRGVHGLGSDCMYGTWQVGDRCKVAAVGRAEKCYRDWGGLAAWRWARAGCNV